MHGLVSGHGHPLDVQLAERDLEVLDDLRPLVGAADHRAELARLVVVERRSRRAARRRRRGANQ